MLQFFLNIHETVDESMAFPFRKMESLVHFIREKSVFLDATAKIGATNQIRMKTQGITLRLKFFARIFYADDLSWSKTDYRSFLVIVPLTAINQIAVFSSFRNIT